MLGEVLESPNSNNPTNVNFFRHNKDITSPCKAAPVRFVSLLDTRFEMQAGANGPVITG